MTDGPDPKQFVAAGLLERALMLLQGSFRDPREPVSRLNVADAIANATGTPNTVGMVGGAVLGSGAGSGSPDPETYRLVSEAWQVLERAGMICKALDPSTRNGDWWVLTRRGEYVRDSGDPEGELGLALEGRT